MSWFGPVYLSLPSKLAFATAFCFGRVDWTLWPYRTSLGTSLDTEVSPCQGPGKDADRVAHIISFCGPPGLTWMFQKWCSHSSKQPPYHLILPLHSFVTALAFGLWFAWCHLFSLVSSTCPRSFVCCGCSARLMLSLWLRMGGVQLLDFRHRDIEDPLLAGDNKLV